jgi:hypothetical protein
MTSGDRIPLRVVHHGRHDPCDRHGGVEAFARRLTDVFEHVEFTWSGERGLRALARDRPLVICDNDTVLDWPRDLPLMAFQHGVAWQKVRVTRTLTDAAMALRQWFAAGRSRTVWIACAHWIADAFAAARRDAPQHVVYHHVDTERFDGRLNNAGSRLVLHDARSPHKGAALIPFLATVLPQWRFEALACRPEEVAARLRKAAAFVHLSRYEGNSIVCLEAMAMNLPCIFTDVGLARDVAPGHVRLDVGLVDAKRAFRDPEYAALEVGRLLAAMRMHPPAPREFVRTNATPENARAGWRRVLADFAARTGRAIDLGRDPSANVSPPLRSIGARG